MKVCFYCTGFIENARQTVHIPTGGFYIHKEGCLQQWQKLFGFKPEKCHDNCGAMVIYYPDSADPQNHEYFCGRPGAAWG